MGISFFQRGNIAGVLTEFFGLQDATHDGAGTGLGQRGHNVYFPRDGDLALNAMPTNQIASWNPFLRTKSIM